MMTDQELNRLAKKIERRLRPAVIRTLADEALLTREEVEALFGTSRTTFYRMRRSGEFPVSPSSHGDRDYYPKSEVLDFLRLWIAEGRETPGNSSETAELGQVV